VPYYTKGSTADAEADFQAAAGTLTFAAGVTARNVTIGVMGDVLNEAVEAFFLHLNCPAGADVYNYAAVSIVDNDSIPSVSIHDAPPALEGQTGTSNAVFTVSLSEPSGRPVTVNYRAVSDTAEVGQDLQAALGAVVLQPGETLKQVLVSINGDVRQEAEETFFLEITSADAATVDQSIATGTILAEDFQFLATGAGAGGGPHVRVFDPLTGQERFGFMAYDTSFTGGVRTATADVNFDGVADIVTAPGPGGGPHIRVFSGKTGEQLTGAIGSFFAYDSASPAASSWRRPISTAMAMPT